MSEENKVSNEAVADSGTENVTQDNAQNEYIADSKKYRKIPKSIKCIRFWSGCKI